MKKNQQEIQLIYSQPKTAKRKSLTKLLIEQDSSRSTQSNQESPKKSHNAQSEVFKQQNDIENDSGSGSKKKGSSKSRKFSWPIWKKLFQYSLKRKYHLFLGLILNLGFAMSVSLLPLKVGIVLDLITKSTASQTRQNIIDLKRSVFQLGIMTLLLAFFTYTRFISLQFLQEFLAMDMRNDFFRRFIENDIYFFQIYKSGELVSRLKSDVGQAKSAVSNNLTYLIRNIVIIISNIVILFTISWKLAFLIMILVPIYSFLTLQYSKRSKILVRDYQDVEAQMSAAVTQKFLGIQLIKAYSTEEKEIQNYGKIIIKGYNINKQKIYLSGLYNSLSEFLPYLGIMIVLLYGGSMVIEGSSQLTAGELTSFILYCSSLAHATSAISSSYTNIINGTYAVQKVFQMLQYKPLIEQHKGQDFTISGDISFKDVTFKYPISDSLSLKNVSFEIKSGDYVAFVGESGSGKSTIVKLIQKFYQIQSGSIRFGPHDQQAMKATFLRRQIGLVNQQATIFSGTIQDNITYGLQDFSLEEMEEAAQRAGCLQFINDKRRFPKRFLTEVSEKGGNLSGGQKQRIAIARALMRKPKIIIFDEATSALDSNSERMVQTSIENLAKAENTNRPTIIVIAHRLSTILKTDRIFVMKSGEVIQSGSHHQLKELRGFYYKLVEKQLGDDFEPISNLSEANQKV